MESLKEKVLKMLNKKDKEKLGNVEFDTELFDRCKYIVYTENGYLFEDGSNSLPCKSLKECAEFIKNKAYKEEYLK